MLRELLIKQAAIPLAATVLRYGGLLDHWCSSLSLMSSGWSSIDVQICRGAGLRVVGRSCIMQTQQRLQDNLEMLSVPSIIIALE